MPGASAFRQSNQVVNPGAPYRLEKSKVIKCILIFKINAIKEKRDNVEY